MVCLRFSFLARSLSFCSRRGIAIFGGSGVAVGSGAGEGDGVGVAAFPPPNSPALAGAGENAAAEQTAIAESDSGLREIDSATSV